MQRMNRLSRTVTGALLAAYFIPLLIFAVLGSSARLMWDDLCIAAVAKDAGVLGGVAHFRNAQFGSYTDLFFLSLGGPVGIHTSAIFTVATLILWQVGLTWLILNIMRLITGSRASLLPAASVAALALAASLHALYSFEALYWFNSSTRYLFPLALITLVMAAAFKAPSFAFEKRRFAAYIFAMSLGGFIAAGSSELYAVVQLILLSLLLALSLLASPVTRRPFLILFGANWLVTCCSLLIQLTAAGATDRMSRFVAVHGMQSRDLATLLPETALATLTYILDLDAFGGLALLLAITLFSMFTMLPPPKPAASAKAPQLKRAPLLFGLLVQLLLLPMLWSHTSDSPQFLGRFSGGYISVVAFNAVCLAALLSMLRLRSRLNRTLAARPNLELAAVAISLALIAALVALTQIRSVHWRAAGYIIITAHSLLFALFWRLSALFAKSARQALTAVLLTSYIGIAVSVAAVVFVNLYVTGNLAERSLAFAPFLLVLQGILWGGLLGYALMLKTAASTDGARILSVIRLVALATASALALVIALRQAENIRPFQQYARDWDARHHFILQALEDGQRSVHVAPYSFDLERHITENSLRHAGCPLTYYNIDEIVVDAS